MEGEERSGRAPLVVEGLRARAGAYLPTGWRGTLAVSALATIFNWRAWVVVKPGLDSSWQAGIADGFTHHLQWGPALDFTYGPYGFAGFLEPFYRMTSAIAFIYILAVTWLLAALLVGGMRRYWGLACAGFITWEVLAVTYVLARTADFAAAAGLGLALCLLRPRSRQLRTTVAVLLGGLGGFAVLVKLNDGVVLLALLALASLGADGPGRERLRSAALGLAVFVGVFSLAWAGAAQSFAHLPSFARTSASLVLGYSANMQGRLAPGLVPWWALAILAVTAIVFAVALRGRARRAQVAAGLMLAGWCWSALKDGFVSGNHFPEFFRIVLTAVALAGVLAVPKKVYAIGLLAAACVTLNVANVPTARPLVAVQRFVGEVADLARPGRFAVLVAQARSRVIRHEPLPSEALALVRGHTLAVEPWEDMVAWADPAARWDPEPIVQSYSAFTTYSDGLDARFLGSARAPQRILYWHFGDSFDFRDPAMDPPATTEAVFCHYRQLAVTGRWQVLERVPDRCGAARVISEVRSHFGQVVAVPRVPGKMVVASFSFQPTLLDQLDAAALKPPSTYLRIWSRRGRHDGAGMASPITYRFVTGTATDPHVLSAPVVLGYAAPFAPATVERLELLGDGQSAGRSPLTVTFSAVSLAAA